jgi:hypothetical protein
VPRAILHHNIVIRIAALRLFWAPRRPPPSRPHAFCCRCDPSGQPTGLFHSITSSAVASSIDGTVMPTALADLRLIASTILVVR